jgi:uncharacterized repeat protein (TIGR03803 family)
VRIGQTRGRFSRLPELRPVRCTGLAFLACALAAIGHAQTPAETVILSFGNFPSGATPYGTPILDASGNLYGTTYQGGAANLGVVFKLGTSGYQVLYSFMGGSDGANPYAGVTLDSTGNLYGTTYNGGAANAGVVYKLAPSGQETVLYSFTGGADGANPYAGVILDSAGNLYGTTMNGGSAKAGVVYEVSPSGQETVLYTFTGGNDGASPYAGVVADRAGNLYGTQPADARARRSPECGGDGIRVRSAAPRPRIFSLQPDGRSAIRRTGVSRRFFGLRPRNCWIPAHCTSVRNRPSTRIHSDRDATGRAAPIESAAKYAGALSADCRRRTARLDRLSAAVNDFS